MLYELVAIVRPGKVVEAKEIARTAGSIILSRAGVIRSLHNWGRYLLPRPIRKHQARYSEGHHFVMRFDCSPDTQEAVKKMLVLDPRMLRFGVVKLGDGTLKGMADIGPARWTRKPANQREMGHSF